MSASRVVWGQIVVVFAIVLFAVWIATQWVAWRLGFQPQLGAPWFSVAGFPIYPPPAFFAWWFFYDAYAPHISGGRRHCGLGWLRRNCCRHPHVDLSGARGEGCAHLRLRPLGRAA